MNKKQAQKAFTLAELLITLSVIGLVAILTIPTMIENHQQKAWNTASTVFERKLEEALKSMNTQETLAGHANTLDFVNELSKHIKINKICKNDNLMSCFEDKGTWNVLDVATKQEKDFTFLFSDKQYQYPIYALIFLPSGHIRAYRRGRLCPAGNTKCFL